MDKYIYNEQNGLWYELQGDYYLPCLKLPEEPELHIGIWGQRHRRYLKSHRRALYTSLLTSGKLNSYIADIDQQAEEIHSILKSYSALQEYNSKNHDTSFLNSKIIRCTLQPLRTKAPNLYRHNNLKQKKQPAL